MYGCHRSILIPGATHREWIKIEAGVVVHWQQRLVDVVDLALQVVWLVRQVGWKDVDGSHLRRKRRR